MAEKYFLRAVKINTNDFDPYNNLGLIYKEKGYLDRSLNYLRKALELNPQSPKTFYNLGLVYDLKNKFFESIKCYSAAVEIDPDYIEANNKLGHAFYQINDFEKAYEIYQKSLKIYPDNIDILSSLAYICKLRKHYLESINFYKKAILLEPTKVHLYVNLGNVQKLIGEIDSAIGNYEKALLVDEHDNYALYNLGISLRGYDFKKSNPNIENILVLILEKGTLIRPSIIVKPIISLLQFNNKIQNIIKNFNKLNDISFLIKSLKELSKIPLLLKLMAVSPIPNITLEKLANKLRFLILSNRQKLQNNKTIIPFCSALSLQCYLNEYLYYQSEMEEIEVSALEQSLKIRLNKKEKLEELDLIILSCYLPLQNLSGLENFNFSESFKDIYLRQVKEPLEELEIIKVLPEINKIKNSTSSIVRKQYEENPYPRWVNIGLCLEPKSINQLVVEKDLELFDKDILKTKSPKVLIAGCGTGQHSNEVASIYKN